MSSKKDFTGVLSGDYEIDPYGYIDRLNKRLNIIYDETMSSYLAISYDAAHHVLTHLDVFSTKPLADRAEPVMRGKVLAQMEGQEHKIKRRMFLQHLTGKIIKEYYEPILTQLCESLIQRVVEKEKFDLITDFGSRYALLSTFDILGVSHKKYQWYLDRLRLIVKFATRFNLSDEAQQTALSASEELELAVLGLIDEKKYTPGKDIISFILKERDCSGLISDSEIVALSLNILLAASEPVDKVLANCIYHLYRNEVYINKLIDGTCKYNNVIQESLRLTPPVHLIPRLIERDVCYEGVNLERGKIIYVLIPSANRDEKYFAMPNVFDPFRQFQKHLSYGAGPHVCIGSQFANMQLGIALKRLVPVIKMYKESAQPKFEGVYIRGATEYHLEKS